MSSFVYDNFTDESLKALIASGTVTVKTMLVSSAYTPSRGSHTRRSDITSEITGTGYTAGGAATSMTVTKDTTNHKTTVTPATVTWSAATLTAAAAVRYVSRGGAASADELVEYLDFGGNQSVTAQDFAVAPSSPITFQHNAV